MKSIGCRWLAWGLLLGICGAAWSTPLSQADWPPVTLPTELQPFVIGEQVSVQGVPVRMQGFVSHLPLAEVTQRLRAHLGPPLVESRVAQQLVLGRAQGAFYISVQVEPAGSGSRGILAVSQLLAAPDTRAHTDREQQHWLSRLPPGSRLVSHMRSVDGAFASTQWIFSNTHAVNLNVERLKAVLYHDGMQLKHEAPTERYGKSSHQDARLLIFQGGGKEALVTLHREASGACITVLNLMSTVERLR